MSKGLGLLTVQHGLGMFGGVQGFENVWDYIFYMSVLVIGKDFGKGFIMYSVVYQIKKYINSISICYFYHTQNKNKSVWECSR